MDQRALLHGASVRRRVLLADSEGEKEIMECTSIMCGAEPGTTPYCKECSHARYDGEGIDRNGKLWRWSFNPRFGPLFLRKDGEPLKNQPMTENHPAWDAFYGETEKGKS